MRNVAGVSPSDAELRAVIIDTQAKTEKDKYIFLNLKFICRDIARITDDCARLAECF